MSAQLQASSAGVPADNSPHTAAVLSVAAGNVIWGFTFLFTRVALRVADPAVMLSVRFVLAFLLMNVLLLAGKGTVTYRGKNPRGLIALAITELVYFYFESYGVLYTNATFSGVVLAVSPIVAIVLAIFLLREYPTRRQAMFCVLPVAGVMLMVSAGKSLGVITPIGAFFLLGSCLTSGAYKTANRKASEQFSSFERTYTMMGASAVVFTVSALFSTRCELQKWTAPLTDPATLACLLALACLGSVTANILVNYAAGILPVVKVSTFGALSTLVTMVAGVLLLHEPMSLMGAVGAVLILVGIWQVTRPC